MMAPSKFRLRSPLPLELLCEIIKFLPLTDLQSYQTLSLASRFTRRQAIHFIFGHLRYTTDISSKVRNIHQARKDVKEVIKKLELRYILHEDSSVIIFQFLETLPNLQILDVGNFFPHAYLSQLISSIRHTALLELVLEVDGDRYAPIEGPPTAGLAGLEKFSISWITDDNPLAHLYELIRPTLSTLVELRIDMRTYAFFNDFDLQLLKPTADTLRTFEYTLQSADESILDTIPAILPRLTNLSIKSDYLTCILWKDAHIEALSKNNNLTDLTLFSDFEMDAQDTFKYNDDYAWFVRCYKRRLKATQDIASACPQLQRCSWVQMDIANDDYCKMSHSFIVEERMTGGNVTRVVRGLKQHWMGRDHHTEWGIVKCKLEDLPGDIIDRNNDECPTEDL